MSLILDALNRSRRDTETVPGIDTQHVVAEPEPVPAGRRLLPWAALGIALLVIVWLLFDRARPEPDRADATVALGTQSPGSALTPGADEQRSRVQEGGEAVQLAASAPVPRPEPAPVPAPAAAPVEVVPQAPAPEREAAVEQLYRQARSAPPVAEPETRPAPVATEQTVAAPEPEPVPAPSPETAPGDEEVPIDLEKMLLQARDEMANSQLVEHPAPFLASLSQQTKNAIPTVLYQRHDYSSDPSRSTVGINGKTLRNGSTAGGFKVDEILPDSVVLTYRGTQFRLRALNSWVNL